MSWYKRLANLIDSDRHTRDVAREQQFHIQELADELEARGMPREAALREAALRFGNRTSMAERTRDAGILTGLESVLRDLRYALRSLRLSPGFTAVAVLSLALGIGANSAIFSLVNAVMLRSLPVDRPGQIVRLTHGPEGNPTFTNPLWEQIRDNSQALVGVMAYGETDFELSTGGQIRTTPGAVVSGSAFGVLGINPVAGRLLTAADDVRGCAALAVVGSSFAQREYGSIAGAVGRALSLGGHSYTVIGVAQPEFTGLSVGREMNVYTPLCSQALSYGPDWLDRRSTWYISVLGRMPEGATLTDLNARLAAEAPPLFEATVPGNWSTEGQAEYRRSTLAAEPAAAGMSAVRNQYGEALIVLMVVTGVVLLIACANVAHLLLARAAARQRELAIRLAIGAGRGRLIRQLLTESLVLAALGSAVGVVFAYWAAGLLVRFLATPRNPVWLDLTPDARVLGFTIAAAALTALLFGLAPALSATGVDPQAAMKAQGRGVTSGPRRFKLGRALVVGQVAMSLALVVAAGLLLRSFHRLTSVDAGFDRSGVLLVNMNLARTGLDSAARRSFHRGMLEQVRALPGVSHASATQITPIGNMSWNDELVVEGHAAATPQDALAWFTAVSPGYMATLGTRLIAGRDVQPSDVPGSEPVAVVNEEMARHFFGSASPIGRSYRIRQGDNLQSPVTIVGVVENAKYRSLDEAPQPIVYLPLEQAEWFGAGLSYVLRTAVPPASLTGPVTALVAAANSTISLDIRTLADQVSESLARPRLMALLSGFFGALALLLAMIGLYGTIAYGVTRRRGEIGVRLALGAARSSVLRMVLGEAGRLVAFGTVLGVAIAWAGSRLLEAFLFGLGPNDPITLIGAALVLAVVALAAGALPAWRASRLDPMTTLREE